MNPNNTQNFITSDQLVPQKPLKLPIQQPDTTAPSLINELAESPYQKAARIKAEKDAIDKSTQLSGIDKAMKDIAGVSAKESTYATELGADKLRSQYDTIQNSIDIETKALQDNIDSLYQNTNLTKDLAGRLANESTRKSASYLANLGIQQNIVAKNFDRANDLAKRKVEAELAPLKADLESKKFIYDENKESFSRSEQALLSSQITQDERNYQKQLKDKSATEELRINILKNNAPQSIKNQLEKATNVDDVLKIPGVEQYLLSPAERLDLQLKGLQIAGLRADQIKEAQKVAEEEKAKDDKNTVAKQIAKDKIDKIDELMTNNGGISAIVGNRSTGRRTSFRLGKANQAKGSVKELVSQEVLDTLLELKSQGGTLGAISEKELDILNSAATKIGGWAVKDKNGNPTGEYSIDEASFKKELSTIRQSTARVYEALGGVLPGSPAESASADNLVNESLQYLTSPENLLLEAGY